MRGGPQPTIASSVRGAGALTAPKAHGVSQSQRVLIFTLPSAEEQTLTNVSPSQNAQTSSLRVLIVDDNEDGADLLAMLLESLGHQTMAVYTGEAALEQAAAFSPHLVLCDIGLPGISGYDVGRALRADAQFARVTLVALTGWGGDEDKQRSKSAGFDHHLVKPVEIAALNDVLATIL